MTSPDARAPDWPAPAATTDSIPRLSHLVAHLRDQLVGMRAGTTFEAARRRYGGTVDRLAIEGVGRRTAHRVDEASAYWSPTVEVLEEAMRLGLVVPEQLPSARRYLDAHRGREYHLTELGQEVSDLAGRRISEFADRLAGAVIDAHPYFHQLLVRLDEAPIVLPVVTEGELSRAREDRRGMAWWSEHLAHQLSDGMPEHPVNADDVRGEFDVMLRRRFGKRELPPSRKELAEAMNDAIVAVGLRARGLPIGPTNLRTLKRWGVELRLLDESRYVPDLEPRNAIWLAAALHVEDGRLRARRRTVRECGQEVAAALVSAYRRQSDDRRRDRETMLDAPYLPIYQVRAQAAYEMRVTRALCDLVLERMVAGGYEDLGVEVQLHLTGEASPPPSEPVYRRGGSRRYEMTMTNRRQVSP